MKIPIRSLCFTLLPALFCALLLLWKAKADFAYSIASHRAENLQAESLAVRASALSRMEALRSDLLREVAAREVAGHGPLLGNINAEIVALFKAGSSLGSWNLAWQEKGLSHKAESWKNGFDATVLASLPFSQVKAGQVLWSRAADAQGKPVYALLFPVDLGTDSSTPAATVGGALPDTVEAGVQNAQLRAFAVALFSVSPLQSIFFSVEDWMLVDDQGFVQAQGRVKWLGHKLVQSPLLNELKAAKSKQGQSSYEDENSERWSAQFSAVPSTNLFAIASENVSQDSLLISNFFWRALVFALASLICLGALAWFLGRNSIFALNTVVDQGLKLPPAVPQGLPAITDVRAKPVQKAGESTSTNIGTNTAELSASLYRVLRQPLAAIIGHAQLARRKSTEAETRGHAEQIEKEARSAKEALERLARLNEPEPPRLSPTSIEDALESALSSLQAKLDEAGVQIEKDYQSVPLVIADIGQLQNIFSRLLENSLEALRARNQKTIHLKIFPKDKSVEVVIQDSGIGMQRDLIDRAFEPFVKGFSGSHHLGLGLAYVKNALELLSAQIGLESAPGEGTAVTLHFPASVSVQAAALINMKAETALETDSISEPALEEPFESLNINNLRLPIEDDQLVAETIDLNAGRNEAGKDLSSEVMQEPETEKDSAFVNKDIFIEVRRPKRRDARGN